MNDQVEEVNIKDMAFRVETRLENPEEELVHN
jgi:hypothetical protein